MTAPAIAAPAPRAHLLGCDIDRVDMDEALAFCERVIESHGHAQHMAINAAKVIAMRDDPALREVVSRCELITADGQSVVWASRLLSDPLPTRVSGIDLMRELLVLAESRAYRVYVLGARPEVLEAAVSRMRDEHPRLRIVGYRDGYYEESEAGEVARDIARCRPHMLFVAMSSPRKEYFLGGHRALLEVPFVMGVGGAVDVVAGATRRAPRMMQRMGLEWLFRLAQEPRRLLRRYTVVNARFVALTLRELLGRRSAQSD